MDILKGGLYSTVVEVKHHLMVQRSLMSNIYQEFCDGFFYYSFSDCYAEGFVQTISDSFPSMLTNLNEIPWNINYEWDENFPNLPEQFMNVRQFIIITFYILIVKPKA